MIFSGQIVDVVRKKIFGGEIRIENGRIADITETIRTTGPYILPGFIDSHVHIESSMLTPAEFGRTVIPHGTIAVLNDPHEIANVCGVDGVSYMIEDSRACPMKYFFGAPSCVPATPFETSGATLGSPEIEALLRKPDVYFLSEMMNYPGVIRGDTLEKEKIRLAKFFRKPIDGHAPGLRGKHLIQYITTGITTDHECDSLEEGRNKIRQGMKILIREGSAAKNFDALMPLLSEFPNDCMFCADDRHPNDLLTDHIEGMVRKAVQQGVPLWNVLQAACLNPIYHYHLPVGLLQLNDPADFIMVDNLRDFHIESVIIHGQTVFDGINLTFKRFNPKVINHFSRREIEQSDLYSSKATVPVMGVIDGQIVTNRLDTLPDKDVLKLVCLNRYKPSEPAIAYVHGFGLKEGAIGSSVAHDSHNILALGTNDSDIFNLINLIIRSKGGVGAISGTKQSFLPLPIAGLMSEKPFEEVNEAYQKIESLAKEFGSPLTSPLMTLSFMSLLVIPKLRLSDKGLFDSEKFEFINPGKA